MDFEIGDSYDHIQIVTVFFSFSLFVSFGAKEICKVVFEGGQPKDLKSGVRKVGLYGVGGVGKSTACRILCNELRGEYCDRVCHVEFGKLSELESLRKVLRAFSDLDDKRLDKISDVGEVNILSIIVSQI